MTLQEAEFIANEFNNLTSVQSAEVVPNMDGDYSVLVTRTDGRRAVSCDLDAADGALTVAKIEDAGSTAARPKRCMKWSVSQSRRQQTQVRRLVDSRAASGAR
jgi:hypothetical protein